MKKKVKRKSVKQTYVKQSGFIIAIKNRVRETAFVLLLSCAVFVLIALFSWHGTDPGWLGSGMDAAVSNLGGMIGAYLSDILLFLLGLIAWLLPPLLALLAWFILYDTKAYEKEKVSWWDVGFRVFGISFIIISSCGLVDFIFKKNFIWLPTSAGGVLGASIFSLLQQGFNTIGSLLILITVLLLGIIFLTGFSLLELIDSFGEKIVNGGISLYNKYLALKQKSISPVSTSDRFILQPKSNFKNSAIQIAKSEIAEQISAKITPVTKSVKIISQSKQAVLLDNRAMQADISSKVILRKGMVPPVTLLDVVPQLKNNNLSNSRFEQLSKLVEQRLLDFGVVVKVIAVRPGPIVTRFELELAPGLKVSKITGLAKDIARSLLVSSVRIVEVIPGKSAIGLELPNQTREPVSLRDLLQSTLFINAKSPVSLALGKDIAGCPVVVDLAKMPHLLVAGTTGSGKSVSINAMLLSMLYKATPENLRFILIDPKMLELSVYEGIPHLLTPVITDMKDAANALRWCVAEMDRRYRLMAYVGVRNLAAYNAKVTAANNENKPISAPAWLQEYDESITSLASLPAVVVVADELADMMMVVGKKVEDLIARISQKARASGIHLILATQRPSVDVITGLIKANIPTRIAFQVSSRIDSRTILDQQGAEQLLGAGDMLYLPPGSGLPVRVHGANVTDDEVHRVVAAWRTYGKPQYLENVTTDNSENNNNSSDIESDPLYDSALKIVTETRRASISLVQRKLRIGYNRAARLMEGMEAAGVVSTMDNSGTREVLAPPPIK